MSADNARTVALVAAKDVESSIGLVVRTLRESTLIDEVVVVDDGSVDDTAIKARSAGARVIVEGMNRGKAHAIRTGVLACPNADVFLLVDGDTAADAGKAIALLEPLRQQVADVAIAVLPSAQGRGGFGVVANAARWGIKRACGFGARAPLSGQRAVRAELLRSMAGVSRFGLETAMTIDTVRRGARVVEVELEIEHHHRGKTVGGFAHRATQGVDVVRALWPRLVGRPVRWALTAALMVAFVAIEVLAAHHHQRGVGNELVMSRDVTVELVPGLRWQDVQQPQHALVASVAVGNTDDLYATVRSGSRDASAPQSDIDVSVATTFRPTPYLGHATHIVVGVDLPGEPHELRPVVMTDGDVSGTLFSPSTKRVGLVDITDIAPTIAALRGEPRPAEASGHALRLSNQPVDVDSLIADNDVATFYEKLRPWFIAAHAIAGLIAAVVVGTLSSRGRYPRHQAKLGVVLVSIPLATYLVRWVVGSRDVHILLWSALLVAGIGMIASMSGLGARNALVAMSRVLGLTVALMVGDLLTGSNLQNGGIFGSSPIFGARYFGLGNPAAALLLSATVLWASIHVHLSADRRDGLMRSAAVFAVVGIAAGLPGLGSDVGGLLSFSIVGVLTIASLATRRIAWRTIGFGSIAAIAALTAAALIDGQRSRDSQTHLGQLVTNVRDDGLSALTDVVARKLDTNLFGYGFPFTLVIVACFAALLYALIATRWGDTVLPSGSSLRIGVTLSLVGSFVLYALNDSGVVMLALGAVYVGPVLLAVHAAAMNARKLEVSVS